MIILNFDPIDHKAADCFLRERVYVSIVRSIDLTDENGHLIHSITTKSED